LCFERIGGLKPTLPLVKEMIKEKGDGGKNYYERRSHGKTAG